MSAPRDEFLSEEDMDLATLTDEELDACWTAWLHQAQATNDEDAACYSHGVFLLDPAVVHRLESTAVDSSRLESV